jgi:hypothetical protein
MWDDSAAGTVAVLVAYESAILAGAESNALPAHLTWQGADDPRWWDGDTAPHGLERFRAHRWHHRARWAFLASVTVRPYGVSELEFLQAHGFTASDRGAPRTRRLTY